ncbi:MAG: lipase maturation factor family protein, partial [Nanoarchaeota archaeon]
MIYKLGRYILERSKATSGYWLTRFVFLRLLGLIYLFAFLSLILQVIPLLGNNGILPADLYLQRIEGNFGSKIDAFFALPTVFWLHISDSSLLILSWIGLILSFIVLMGYANSILMGFLWALYMSFVHIGQLFYSY